MESDDMSTTCQSRNYCSQAKALTLTRHRTGKGKYPWHYIQSGKRKGCFDRRIKKS